MSLAKQDGKDSLRKPRLSVGGKKVNQTRLSIVGTQTFYNFVEGVGKNLIFKMASILNTHLPKQKKVRRALSGFKGLGRVLSNQICDQLGLSKHLCVKDLKPSQVDQLTRIISQYYYVGLDLKRLIQQDLNHLVVIGCYKGVRHTIKLPARGQRTHTNARTTRSIASPLNKWR